MTDLRVADDKAHVIQLTDTARDRIARMMAKAPAHVIGLRLSTPQKGCSGFSYAVDYVDAPPPGAWETDTGAGPLFVDEASIIYLKGTTMDWQEDDFAPGFVFRNPNASGSCGCGDSFTIAMPAPTG